MKKEEKDVEYASKIMEALSELLAEDSDSEFKIDLDEFKDDDNLTAFFHALANLVPSYFYGKFTGEKLQSLDFNYIANKLCVKYAIEESKIK